MDEGPSIAEFKKELMEEREIARENWRNSGLAYKDINKEDINELKQFIKYELQTYLPTTEHSRSMDMRLSKDKKKHISYNRDGSVKHGGIFIAGSYFNEREGIYFNGDGFIGFCGWADGSNKIPIIDGFNKWLDKRVAKKINDAECREGCL